MAYKTVDLRGKLLGNPASPDTGSQKKTKGVVVHYNGDPGGYTGVAGGRRHPADVYAADARWHIRPGGFDGYTGSGIMYHFGVWEDTVYILRNPDANLWHCNDGVARDCYNYAATAVNVPISQNERATARTLRTLREFVTDELRRQGHGTRLVKGHQEISDNLCPGSLMGDFVRPFRATGGSATGPFASWVNLAIADGALRDARLADAANTALGAVGFGKVGVTSRVAKAARDARDGALGEYPCVLIGAPALAVVPTDVPLYADPERKVWFSKGKSDLWDAVGSSYAETEAKVGTCIAEICRRMGLDANKATAAYAAELKKLPDQGGKPTPKPTPNRRGSDEIRGTAIFSEAEVLELARKHGAAPPALEMIPPIYRYARERDLGGDFLSVQMLHETGFGKYGGASRAYNPAGIKTRHAKGDAPGDFEVPATANEGARLLVNHWCAVLSLEPIGTPHGRFSVARDVYAKKPKITRISQLGNGNWATDPQYYPKLKRYLDELADSGMTPTPPKRNDVESAIAYGLKLVGAPYSWWHDGMSLSRNDAPAWAVDDKAPDPVTVKARGVFCAGVGVLMLRATGRPVPKNGDYPGGTKSWQLNYRMVPFRLDELRRGDILFRPFQYAGSLDQGHWSVALGGADDKVLQSFANHVATIWPGVNATYTARESHDGGYYVYRIPREAWLG